MNYNHDTEQRKRGPFSIFLLSYELPPEPKDWKHPHDKHQHKMEKQRIKKILAREWHHNPNRKRSVPPICLV